jgi:hypothetical protein
MSSALEHPHAIDVADDEPAIARDAAPGSGRQSSAPIFDAHVDVAHGEPRTSNAGTWEAIGAIARDTVDVSAWEADDALMAAMGLGDPAGDDHAAIAVFEDGGSDMFDSDDLPGEPADTGTGSAGTATNSSRSKAPGFRKPAFKIGHARPPHPQTAGSAAGLPTDGGAAGNPIDHNGGTAGSCTESDSGVTSPAPGARRAFDGDTPLGADFRELLALLHQHGVRYLVVGGFAVAVHGRPRFTPALDLWIDATGDNAARIVAALADFGFATGDLHANDLVEPGTAFELGHAPNRVDLLTSLRGVSFAAAYPARTEVRIGDIAVTVIDRASLIANKRAVGRPRDLDDVSKIVLRRDLQPVPRTPGGERDAASGWRSRTAADRIAQVEDLRRQWIEITGNPDLPMARFVSRRILDHPKIQQPR